MNRNADKQNDKKQYNKYPQMAKNRTNDAQWSIHINYVQPKFDVTDVQD